MTYQQYPVVGPFGGFVDNVPSPHTPPNSFDEITNWLCRKGRFHTRFRLDSYTVPPDGAQVKEVRTFSDIQNNLHTLVLTTANAYMLTTGPTYNLLTYPVGVVNLTGTALPYGTAVAQGKLFFSNGSKKILYADGEASLKSANAIGSARFLALQASHLIAAYTVEPAPGTVGAITFPVRVRWSKSGDPTDWTSFTSGSTDLLEVPDVITGLATLGRNTVIFRTNGWSIMTPTGIGSQPFDIENISIAKIGIGNRYPYSLALFGNNAVFVSSMDIHLLTNGLQLSAIGTKSKKRIMKQLGDATSEVVGFAVAQLSPGVDYLSYWLSIPPDNLWVYHYDEDNWMEFSSVAGTATYMATVTLPE